VLRTLEDHPDVILCDINMPGMQGDEVAFALSQDPRTARVPLIYLTALVGPDEAPDLEGVFGDFLTISKSASTEELRTWSPPRSACPATDQRGCSPAAAASSS
jgi:CheY-like chemotaxis protein